jgi:hydroxymethylpyrimidine/phosphomethylpyrimidine kinase
MTSSVLSIAGLDPSGGAGVAADLKMATAMGSYSMAALTTVTVQHPGDVSRVAPLPAAMVSEQVKTLLQTMPIGAIKIGMIGSTEIADVLISTLQDCAMPIVLDPVQSSTSGSTLGHIDRPVFDRLIAMATIVTPNSGELQYLLNDAPPGRWAIDNSVAILHTGGHAPGNTIHDVLWLPNGTHRRWSHPRVETRNTHGTGCTLSTALAVGLAQGLDISEAVEQAVQFTVKLIERSATDNMVADNGPLLHFKLNE